MRLDADRVWELWNIRAFWPEAGPEDLERIRAGRELVLAKEREAFAGLWSGDRGLLAPGHGFFARHPQLRRGVVVSAHLGPYKLLPLPYLQAGISPAVMVNVDALEQMKPDFDRTRRRLGLRTSIHWIPVGSRRTVRELMRAVRERRPVLVYYDGNSGGDGYRGTRDQGLPYRLPGREIRLRNGLARLICRLGLPVHCVDIHWNERFEPEWSLQSTPDWGPAHDPDRVAGLLADWMFARIQKHPEQWHFWTMLKESSACFSTSSLSDSRVPAGLQADYQRAFLACCERSSATVRMVLQAEAEVWPGDVLADLTEDRFFDAAGLCDEDLDPLRRGDPTLAELAATHGTAWLHFHGLRLCLLGMARLGG